MTVNQSSCYIKGFQWLLFGDFFPLESGRTKTMIVRQAGPVPAPKPNKREMKSYFLPPQASFVGGNISIRCQRTF